MRLLFRFGIFALLFGFVAGLIARRALGLQRIPEVLLASLLPWVLHLIYVLRRVILVDGFSVGVVLVALLSIGVAALLLRLAPRFYRPQHVRVAAVPAMLAALHGVILLVWSSTLPFSPSTTLASVAFVWGTLFFVTALWTYALPAPKFPNFTDLGRRR